MSKFFEIYFLKMNNFQLVINLIQKALIKHQTQIIKTKNRNNNIDLFINNFAKINEKYKDFVDSMPQKISNFDELFNNELSELYKSFTICQNG